MPDTTHDHPMETVHMLANNPHQITNSVLHENIIGRALDELPYVCPDLTKDLALFGYAESLPHMPTNHQAQEYVFEYLLVNLISERYGHQRRVFGLAAPQIAATRFQARQALRLDAQQGVKQLLIWSTLYHRYVRIDLEFSLQAISQLVSCTPRTLRRYREEGIRCIAHDLFWIEWYLQTTVSQNTQPAPAQRVGAAGSTTATLPDDIWWVLAIARRVLAL